MEKYSLKNEKKKSSIFRFIEESWKKEKNYSKNNITYLDKVILSNILNAPIEEANIWIENRNSVIYKIHLKGNSSIIGKQSKNLSYSNLLQEYESILKLYELNDSIFSNPNALSINKKYNIYFMEYISGNSIADQLKVFNHSLDFNKSVQLIGKNLGKIHKKWNKNIKYKNVSTCIINDLKFVPINLSSKHKKTLKNIEVKLRNSKAPYGLVYRDFDPLNIYVDNNKVSLIDPPEEFVTSSLYWDLATFIVGIKKSLLKKKVNIFVNNNKFIEKISYVLIKSYNQELGYNLVHFDTIKFNILLLELQRLGELIVNQTKHKNVEKGFSIKKMKHLIAIILLKREYYKILKRIEHNKL